MTSSPPRGPFDQRSFRVPAGLGCLVALIAVPLALLAAFVTVVRSLLRPSSRRSVRTSSPMRGAPRSAAAGGVELCEFVQKMSLDDDFDLDDAREAGVPVDRGVTAEGLVEQGVANGWIERRGERLAVTSRGRAESRAHLDRLGL